MGGAHQRERYSEYTLRAPLSGFSEGPVRSALRKNRYTIKVQVFFLVYYVKNKINKSTVYKDYFNLRFI